MIKNNHKPAGLFLLKMLPVCFAAFLCAALFFQTPVITFAEEVDIAIEFETETPAAEDAELEVVFEDDTEFIDDLEEEALEASDFQNEAPAEEDLEAVALMKPLWMKQIPVLQTSKPVYT